MKKFVLSVMSTLLSTVLLVGCAPQPTVSTDAPATTRTATTTAAITTTTITTSTTTITAKPTTTTTSATKKTTKTSARTSPKTTPKEYDIRFEEDTSVGWERIPLGKLLIAGEKDYDDPDDLYIVDGHADMYLNGKWVSLKEAVRENAAVLPSAFMRGMEYVIGEQTPPQNFIDGQSPHIGFSYAQYTDYILCFWHFQNECPQHPYDKTNATERKAFQKSHSESKKTVYMVCPPDRFMDNMDDLEFCTGKPALTAAPPTTSTRKLSKEYSIRFEKDTSVGWKRLHKQTENFEQPDFIHTVSTGSYIVDGNAKVYVNGKWISLKKAIKNDPTVMEKIWGKALRDNAAKSTEHAYPKDFITMRQLRGDGVNYAKYTGYTLTYWTAAGDNPGVTPCPVHEYPGIGDRKWEDLTEKEKQDYLKILREHEHSHNVRWYMILPPDAPIPTWDDIYEKGICYMDF